jgi:hypothetical protein
VGLVIAALLLSGCAGSSARPPSTHGSDGPAAAKLAPLDTFNYSGTGCTEISIEVDVPAVNVQPFVPAKFKPIVNNGKAHLLVAGAKCTKMTIGAAELNNVLESDVGVFIDDPEGGRAPVVYQFWLATNRQPLRENMSRVGMTTGWAATGTLYTFALFQSQNAEVYVPWQGNLYRIEGVGAMAPMPPATVPFVWWHSSDNSTVKVTYELALHTEGPLEGKVHTEPGTMMSKLLGANDATGAGLMHAFDLRTTTKRTAA